MITGPDFTDNRGGMTGFLEKVSIRGIFEKVDLINSEFLKEIRITDELSEVPTKKACRTECC
jgi:hypothetical protein